MPIPIARRMRAAAERLSGAVHAARGRSWAARAEDDGRGRVDLVMPAHDVGRFIDEAIRSVLSQDRPRLRLFVLDDDSQDDTASRVERWVRRDARVRLVRVAHHDPNAVRNDGIARADGEYLGFLDADDRLRPGALRDLVRSLERSGSDFAVGSYDRLVGSERRAPAFWIDEAHARERLGTNVRSFPEVMVNAVQWTKLYRRSFWDAAALEFPSGGHFQDQLVSARAYSRAAAFDVLARKTVDWRIRGDGSSMTQQGVRAAQVRDRFTTALGALAVLDAETDEATSRARLLQFLSNDAAIAAAELRGMDREAFDALGTGLAALAERADRAIWEQVPAESKVLFEFVLRGDRARALEYLDRGGLDSLAAPLVVHRGQTFVGLPFWQDPEAAVPIDRFRAAPRELRAYAEQPRRSS
ncbi:glycosyltransferase family 2 protein [Agromyces soli]|uniref:Glycosyltransferase n=1 Tax=Agromyces soli TaxID=659012 RepID=A0ABY4AV16_9MICO|nr:glycosyltransferase family 2 protein [Agromyces soli]UOE26011.1 glycosyltransferase [Agromyces soli]